MPHLLPKLITDLFFRKFPLFSGGGNITSAPVAVWRWNFRWQEKITDRKKGLQYVKELYLMSWYDDQLISWWMQYTIADRRFPRKDINIFKFKMKN